MGKTNGLAIASLILGICGICIIGICAPIALILGAVSLSQIKKTGQGGKGMAITGIVLGIIGSIVWLGWFILWMVGIAAMGI